jgi:two-component system response regulator CpxR
MEAILAEGQSLLLVDDDTELCQMVAAFFRREGFTVEAVHDGRAGMARALSGDFDLVILDVMLPVLSGLEVLEQVRRRSKVPIILLTARVAEQDRIDGLDAGADDYLPKPFGPNELVARVRAVLRRSGKGAAVKGKLLELGDLKVNSRTRRVWRNGEPVELTSTEFEILDLLAREAGRIVTRDELTSLIHQRPAGPYERSLDVHISHLRKKIDKPGETPLIRTVRGVGYLLTPPEAGTA